MDKIPMNLEQTVQYLLDEVNKLKAGIAPGELIPGPQGVQGPEGQKPEVSISNATGNWVIDGVDTGKPSRGKQGEKGNTGMQGVPGVGVATMLSIDSTDYTPTVTDDGEYQDVESSADIKYSDGGVEHSTQVDFNIKVPKGGVDPDKTPYRDSWLSERIPVKIPDGWAQVNMVSATPEALSIVRRTGTGTIYAGTPTQRAEAANKAYVDDNTQKKLYKHNGYFYDSDRGSSFYYCFISTKSTAYTLAELKSLTANVMLGTTYYYAGNSESLLADFSFDNYSNTFSFTDINGVETQVGKEDVSLAYDIVHALS